MPGSGCQPTGWLAGTTSEETQQPTTQARTHIHNLATCRIPQPPHLQAFGYNSLRDAPCCSVAPAGLQQHTKLAAPNTPNRLHTTGACKTYAEVIPIPYGCTCEGPGPDTGTKPRHKGAPAPTPHFHPPTDLSASTDLSRSTPVLRLSARHWVSGTSLKRHLQARPQLTPPNSQFGPGCGTVQLTALDPPGTSGFNGHRTTLSTVQTQGCSPARHD